MNTVTKAKLNIKMIVGNISKVVDKMKEGEVLKLCSLIGRVSVVKKGLDVFGANSLFVGEFEAVDYQTDITYKSTKCFLPEPLQSLVLIELEHKYDVQFAVEIEVIKKGMFLVGYSSNINFIRPPEHVDILKIMRESVMLVRSNFMNECAEGVSDCGLPYLDDGEESLDAMEESIGEALFPDESKIKDAEKISDMPVENLEEVAIKPKARKKQ